MRALVVSTEHPDEPAIFEQWIAPLLRDGWDVIYAAPFADSGTKPHAGLTGLDLPVGRAELIDHKMARSILSHRGSEVDLIVVSSDQLAELAPHGVRLIIAGRSGSVRSLADARAWSSATPSAT